MIKRLSNVNSVKQIEVIQVNSIRGEGTERDPITEVTEYFLANGTRLARVGWGDKPEKYIEQSNDK